MKNLIILALTSMLLFSVSAGLSVWLKQSKDEAAKSDAKETKKEAEKKEPEKKAADKDDHAKPADKHDAGHGSDAGDRVSLEREKVQRRAERLELVLKDAHEVQETHDRLAKQVVGETKAALERNIELGNRADELQKKKDELEKQRDESRKAPQPADLKKQQDEADAAEAKNLAKMASLVEAMPADKAALQLQDLANSGKMDTAVKLLARMKERQAAKVLAEVSDIALAGQLLDKMRTTTTRLAVEK